MKKVLDLVIITVLMPVAILNYFLGNLLIVFTDWQVVFGQWYADKLGDYINGND
jgi:hypothetical protein